MSKETIKKIEKKEYNGKVSYSIEFFNDKHGLLTSSSLDKFYGGALPEAVKEGAQVEVEFETVTKKDGSGTWTSVAFTDFKKEQPKGSFGKGGYPKQEDAESKIVNTAAMVTADIIASYNLCPTGKKEAPKFEATYAHVADIMWKKYKEFKGI